jgi:hemoglobin-like flavoprotein
MNSRHLAIVRSTLATLAPAADDVARRFYERLFELDPQLRSLFKGDMSDQGRSLMAMIGAGVAGLDRIETLQPALAALGARHRGYGVRDAHYAIVAEALLDTLAVRLGPAFTAEARAAWTQAYSVLAGGMQAGAPVHSAS